MSRTEAAKLWLVPFVGKSGREARARKPGSRRSSGWQPAITISCTVLVAAVRRIRRRSRQGQAEGTARSHYRDTTAPIIGRYDRDAGSIFPRSCSVASRLRPIIRHPSNHAHTRPIRICNAITSACDAIAKATAAEVSMFQTDSPSTAKT